MHSVRTGLLVAMLVGFAGLGVIDLLNGQLRTGVAALLLASANYLLLVS